MKKYIFPLLVLAILTGCSTEGDIKFINRTDNYLYFTIKNNDYILEGSEETNPTTTVSVDTGKKFLFYDEGSVDVDLHLEGETFMMQDATIGGQPIGVYVTETTLKVKPEETLKIYCDPTHAGVKLINNSDQVVYNFAYFTAENNIPTPVIELPIAIGDSAWSRLEASTNSSPISYSFIIEYEDGTADSTSYMNIDWLSVGEQLRIELQ